MWFLEEQVEITPTKLLKNGRNFKTVADFELRSFAKVLPLPKHNSTQGGPSHTQQIRSSSTTTYSRIAVRFGVRYYP